MTLVGKLLAEIAPVDVGLGTFVYFDAVAAMFSRYQKRMHSTNFIPSLFV